MRRISKKLSIAALAATVFTGAPLLVTASPAQAQDDAEADAGEEVSPARRIVCRRMAAPSGSRLGARNICRTQAQWDIAQREIRTEVQRQQDLSHWSGNE